MKLSIFKRAAGATFASLALLAACAPAVAAGGHVSTGHASTGHVSIKRAFSLPPSADLSYSVQARQRGMTLNGESLTTWRADGGKYTLAAETHVPLFGKIIEHKSEGAIDEYGLAPLQFYEKRFRKEPSTTTFQRDSKSIVFSQSSERYPLTGGEQDRASALWQLLALARGAPRKFKPGSEWVLLVAGRRDAEPWSFKVVGREQVHTGQGDVSAVHLVKTPPPHDQGQQVDIWLAPSLDWFPVRVRFADNDGDFFEQTLEKISR